jgi:hypothetical protein
VYLIPVTSRDDNEIRFFHNAIDTLAPVPAAHPIFVHSHPTVFIDNRCSDLYDFDLGRH